MLPLGDYPNPPKPQWATRILIAINVAIYLLITVPLDNQGLTPADLADTNTRAIIDDMFARVLPYLEPRNPHIDQAALKVLWQATISRYDLLVERYGYKPNSPDLLALLLCMFLHAGFIHLAGNMLFLWIYGDNIEYRLGTVPYLISYIATGIVATILFATFNAGSGIPLVGASGAISGVLGFYLIWFPYNYIRVLLFLPPFFLTFVHIRAVFVLAVYLLLDNLLPFLMQRGSGGGVAHIAHIGGFLSGIGAALLFDRAKGRIPPPRPQAGYAGGPGRPVVQASGAPTPNAPVPSVEDVTATFGHAIEHQQMEDAAHSFARISREGGRPPQDNHVFALASWLYDNDFTQDAAAVFRFYLKSYPQGGDLDRANLGLGILLARRLDQPTGARQYLLAAIDLAPDGSQVAEVARAELNRLGG